MMLAGHAMSELALGREDILQFLQQGVARGEDPQQLVRGLEQKTRGLDDTATRGVAEVVDRFLRTTKVDPAIDSALRGFVTRSNAGTPRALAGIAGAMSFQSAPKHVDAA